MRVTWIGMKKIDEKLVLTAKTTENGKPVDSSPELIATQRKAVKNLLDALDTAQKKGGHSEA